MLFFQGVNEVLDLGHSKLTHAEKTLLRVDLVTETKTNLCSCERHLAVVVFYQTTEIHEDTLCSFRSKESFTRALWSDLSGKHKIKRHSFRQVITSLWCFNFQFTNSLVQSLR